MNINTSTSEMKDIYENCKVSFINWVKLQLGSKLGLLENFFPQLRIFSYTYHPDYQIQMANN